MKVNIEEKKRILILNVNLSDIKIRVEDEAVSFLR